MKPIIGLTTYGRHEKAIKTPHYDGYFYIPALYIDAVRRAGGLPVLLPVGDDDLDELLQTVDGVIVIGGADIHPAEYNGNPNHAHLTQIDVERDASDLRLVRYLVEHKSHPTLCICRGMQVLNVALGGTLHEHIADVLDEDIHRSSDGGWAVQPVMVDADSLLASVMQTTEVATYSGHHQGVKDVADGLRVVAQAADGIVEALEMDAPDSQFFIGVQWHPEVSAHEDPTQQRLFDALVEAAAFAKLQHTKVAPRAT
ncbi:MAG: gamma-glutamyl-gamma-aminobutyrate hydrolase family protein [Chloroflexi bacterium]|nr:MAG: gamma-glutamyl-gamma-aminobutyrate hydrolase family protein [Chloroflexota bacterium]